VPFIPFTLDSDHNCPRGIENLGQAREEQDEDDREELGKGDLHVRRKENSEEWSLSTGPS
jgi:hypothetical protein